MNKRTEYNRPPHFYGIDDFHYSEIQESLAQMTEKSHIQKLSD